MDDPLGSADDVHAKHERYHTAICRWTSQIDDASRRGDRQSLAAAYSNLAAIYRELGDVSLARRFQQQALQFQEDCTAVDLLHLANDALALKRWRLADSLLEAAAKLADADDPLQATLLATAGVAQLLQGEPRQAVRLLRAAYRQHLSQGDDREAGKDLLNLAAACHELRRWLLERKCLDRAGRHFDRAGMPLSRRQARVRRREANRLLILEQTDPQAN
jgi:tetratricopeptide (TPR) repeat protein